MQVYRPLINAVSEITKSFDFVGDLEDNQSALLTDAIKYQEDDHLFALREDEEVIVGEVGGQSVQLCQDHWQRIGVLMGWEAQEPETTIGDGEQAEAKWYHVYCNGILVAITQAKSKQEAVYFGGFALHYFEVRKMLEANGTKKISLTATMSKEQYA